MPRIERLDRITVFSMIVILLVASINMYLFLVHHKHSSKNDVHRDKSVTNKRLVWPDELPVGDRIKEQIVYVPNGYKYEKTPIKTILIYTGLNPSWEKPQLGQGEFFGCAISQCVFTVNISLAPIADALLFRHIYVRPSFIRPPNQIWIMYHTESPFLTPPIMDNDVFNWTINYRWDSDIPRPYGYFLKYEPTPPLPRVDKNYAVNKTKQIAWFVSNCKPSNNRSEYAAELSKHISVDIYGACGTLECPRLNKEECFQMLDKQYKFYLAFENAHCLYYVTEKLFLNALRHDIVPIVMGPSRRDYELVAPFNSFIHVDDFETPKDLAEYLHKLDKNDTLYNEYLKWKDTGTVVNNAKYYCRLCAMLHDEDRPPKSYNNFTDWWNGAGVCHR